MKVPGVKRPAKGVAPAAAANFSTGRWPVFLDADTDISGAFNGNNGTSCQQKLLPGSLQINADAITFLFVNVLLFIWKSRLVPPK